MLKNNKGFMLIETIIVSTVVITAMIGLYTSFNKLYNAYQTKISYYNLDATYATKEIIDSIMTTNTHNDTANINNIINQYLTTDNFVHLISNKTCHQNINVTNCQNLQELYNIENVIFVKYTKNALKELNAKNNYNQTFKDYVNYLITYYDINTNQKEYSYIILTEVKNEDKYVYANMRMR